MPPQVPTALDLDTRGAMQLAAVPIAGMREQTFTAGLDESEGAE